MSGNAGKSTVQAGWYPDPDDATLNRWWDGSAWTNHRSTLAAIQARADATAKSATTAVSKAASATSKRVTSVSSPIYDSVATVRKATTTSSSPREVAASRPVSAARTFGAPKDHKKLPEISQPSNAGYTTAAVFAIISVIVGTGIIVGLLFS